MSFVSHSARTATVNNDNDDFSNSDSTNTEANNSNNDNTNGPASATSMVVLRWQEATTTIARAVAGSEGVRPPQLPLRLTHRRRRRGAVMAEENPEEAEDG